MWYIRETKHLHCFFVVIKENESALIIGSKLNPFLVWRWVIQIDLLRSDAQLMICPQFLPQFPWSCLSWQDPSRSSRRKVAAQRALDFSQTNYHLTQDFPMFSIAYSVLSEGNSSVKIIFISQLTTTSLFWGGIFQRSYFFKYVNKYVQQFFLLRGATRDITKCDRFSKVRRLIKFVTKHPFKHLFNFFH